MIDMGGPTAQMAQFLDGIAVAVAVVMGLVLIWQVLALYIIAREIRTFRGLADAMVDSAKRG